MREVIMQYQGEGEDLHDLRKVGELVRCKDCKWWRQDHTCREHSLVTPMCANEFCSRGQRKEDDE